MILALGFLLLLWAYTVIIIGFWWAMGLLFFLLAFVLTGIGVAITCARGIFYEHRRREHF